MWGRDLVNRYPDLVEFVGLCDPNPKRAVDAKSYIGAGCPTFTNFDEMIEKTKPDLLMVTTVDGFHHEYIVKGLDRGLDVMTEKPLTTDETKCQAILDAEKRNNRQIVVTFNYRYAPAHQQMKEILHVGRDRQGHLGRLQLVPRRDPRRRLLPPLAPAAQEQRLAAGPQSQPSLRSDELVARRGSGGGVWLRRSRRLRQERHLPRHAIVATARTRPSAGSTTT